MELYVDKSYQIIGKVESINYGAHFCNTTVLTMDGQHINLKLEVDQMEEISMGKVYQFDAIAVVRVEDDLILKTTAIEKKIGRASCRERV